MPELPDNPGPAILGHEPLVGTVRRNNDIPVLRDMAIQRLDDMDVVNRPSEPVLPFIRSP